MTNLREIKLRFETNANVPPPYSYKYEMVFRTSAQHLNAEINMVYTDRDEIDADEIEAEGFTANDDFAWKGRLDKVWQNDLEEIAAKTTISSKKQSEDADFLEVEIVQDDNTIKGVPVNKKTFEFLAQELMQAIFESSGKERAFELNVLKIEAQQKTEAKLIASFITKTITVSKSTGISNYEWSELTSIMQTLFAPEYIQEEGNAIKPTTNGLFIEIGDEIWYEVGVSVVELGSKSNALPKLKKLLDKILA